MVSTIETSAGDNADSWRIEPGWILAYASADNCCACNFRLSGQKFIYLMVLCLLMLIVGL